MRMRLKELTIAGFRGFKLPKTIPLDADIVVIHGSNGSGKSSIVEALEWLLLGDISHHECASSRSGCRGDYLHNVLEKLHLKNRTQLTTKGATKACSNNAVQQSLPQI